MMTYRDMTFCTDKECIARCPRKLTQKILDEVKRRNDLISICAFEGCTKRRVKGMKIELESKFEVGDKLYTEGMESVTVVKVEFSDGFSYLIEYEDEERRWKLEDELRKDKRY